MVEHVLRQLRAAIIVTLLGTFIYWTLLEAFTSDVSILHVASYTFITQSIALLFSEQRLCTVSGFVSQGCKKKKTNLSRRFSKTHFFIFILSESERKCYDDGVNLNCLRFWREQRKRLTKCSTPPNATKHDGIGSTIFLQLHFFSSPQLFISKVL